MLPSFSYAPTDTYITGLHLVEAINHERGRAPAARRHEVQDACGTVGLHQPPEECRRQTERRADQRLQRRRG